MSEEFPADAYCGGLRSWYRWRYALKKKISGKTSFIFREI